MAGKDFDAFKRTIEREFMGHPVVKKNDYTAWFANGDVQMDHLREVTVQFSVFSNQFLLAALNRVINADTLQAARESNGRPAMDVRPAIAKAIRHSWRLRER